jgi:hypothetical protein
MDRRLFGNLKGTFFRHVALINTDMSHAGTGGLLLMIRWRSWLTIALCSVSPLVS